MCAAISEQIIIVSTSDKYPRVTRLYSLVKEKKPIVEMTIITSSLPRSEE